MTSRTFIVRVGYGRCPTQKPKNRSKITSKNNLSINLIKKVYSRVYAKKRILPIRVDLDATSHVAAAICLLKYAVYSRNLGEASHASAKLRCNVRTLLTRCRFRVYNVLRSRLRSARRFSTNRFPNNREIYGRPKRCRGREPRPLRSRLLPWLSRLRCLFG